MLARAVVLSLLALLSACGGGDAAERTYLCGSYEPVGEGSTASEPPCGDSMALDALPAVGPVRTCPATA